MKHYFISLALLGLSAFASANKGNLVLWECVTNKQQKLSLVVQKNADKDFTLFFGRDTGNGMALEYKQDLDNSYLYQYANGTQLVVPNNGKWYLFEETEATTGFTHVELVVRNAKTGQVLEYQECESDVVSHIAELSTNNVKPLPDDLAEWLFEVSNKYLP